MIDGCSHSRCDGELTTNDPLALAVRGLNEFFKASARAACCCAQRKQPRGVSIRKCKVHGRVEVPGEGGGTLGGFREGRGRGRGRTRKRGQRCCLVVPARTTEGSA